MNEYSLEKITSFFSGIANWRNAYRYARFTYLAVKENETLLVVCARIYLDIAPDVKLKPIFSSGNIHAAQWDIPIDKTSIEDVIMGLLSTEGLLIEDHGRLTLAKDEGRDFSASSPILLHQEGLANGNRLSLLSISGAQQHTYFPQPETDWRLKAGSYPYDNLNELTLDYRLGTLRGDYASLEVVATNAVQVYAKSHVQNDTANIGIWMARNLDKNKAHLGYRVVEKGNVVKRDIILGNQLTWNDDNDVVIGVADIEVPIGAVIQCFACYDGEAHQTQWFADPSIFLNPRTAVLSAVDSTGQLLRSYLLPDLPPKGRAADDFEAAISWVLWALGFAPANFGLNNKTRDSFDTVAVSPNGDFLLVECTLGLLRAESKLSKLAARAANLREMLDKSNMRHLRILPVIITAMNLEQVKADIAQAEETGILVLTKENLEKISNELVRFPNADSLYERGIVEVREKSKKTKDLFAPSANQDG